MCFEHFPSKGDVVLSDLSALCLPPYLWERRAISSERWVPGCQTEQGQMAYTVAKAKNFTQANPTGHGLGRDRSGSYLYCFYGFRLHGPRAQCTAHGRKSKRSFQNADCSVALRGLQDKTPKRWSVTLVGRFCLITTSLCRHHLGFLASSPVVHAFLFYLQVFAPTAPFESPPYLCAASPIPQPPGPFGSFSAELKRHLWGTHPLPLWVS